MLLSKGKAIADHLVIILSPFCDRIHIAGSIRREKPHVNDIEIVCQPKRVKLEAGDLFGEGTVVIPDFGLKIKELAEEIICGEISGRMVKFWLKPDHSMTSSDKIKVDLFLPQAHDYYRQLAIRTGDSNYSTFTIATGWRKIGWVGTDDGLRRQEDCKLVGKNKWLCFKEHPTLPPVWQSEEEFFHWLGIKWLNPNQRI